MNTRETLKWVYRGYADAHDRTPYKRAPKLPKSELCLRREEAPPEAAAYWDGWDAGILDAATATIRQQGV